MVEIKGTTICGVKRDGKVAIAGDGQVTMGQSIVMKNTARKVRRLYKNQVVVGFAGAVADAFTLCDKFEGYLEEYHGNLQRAAVSLVVASGQDMLILSGNGEVIEPDDGIAAIGSGGAYALAAARALLANTELSAKEIAYKAIDIASDICVFTNKNIITEEA